MTFVKPMRTAVNSGFGQPLQLTEAALGQLDDGRSTDGVLPSRSCR